MGRFAGASDKGLGLFQPVLDAAGTEAILDHGHVNDIIVGGFAVVVALSYDDGVLLGQYLDRKSVV